MAESEIEYAKRVYNYYLMKGYEPVQAAAMAANSAHEGPGGPTQLGDSGTAFGRFQWRGERQARLQQYAKERGLDPTKDSTQFDFADYELRNQEKGPGQQFFTATTPEEANDAMMNYLRPAGQEKGARAVPSYNSRLQMAQQFQGLPQTAVAYSMAPTKNIGLGPQGAMQIPDVTLPVQTAAVPGIATATPDALDPYRGLLGPSRMSMNYGSGLLAAANTPGFTPMAFPVLQPHYGNPAALQYLRGLLG
jgi:hypothetical protein